MELLFDIKSWEDLRMQDEIPSYLWVVFLQLVHTSKIQELNLEAKFYSEMKYTYNSSPSYFSYAELVIQ